MTGRGELDDFWTVIPAGGAGTRLWPLSRAGSPKFLHDLTGRGRSLLQATADRLEPLSGDRLVVVTGVRHEEAVRAQLPALAPEATLAEPSPRDSMAAIAWAAAVIERIDTDAVLGSFAADHVVGAEEDFRDAVREAVAVARTGLVVTLGIRPTYPATGFGDALDIDGAPHARAVREFVEKPDEATARRYFDTGEFRWNAGMFVVKARVLLDLLATYHPALAAGARRLAAEPACLSEVWPGLEKIAIDHAIAEPAADDGRVAVVRGDFPWDDVGDFDSLAGLLPRESHVGTRDGRASVAVLGNPRQVLALDASGLVAAGSERVVAVLGVDDIVVIDTPDALLVTTRDRAQDVKSIVATLAGAGRQSLT